MVQFTGSADNGVPPYTYDWDFGDGSSSSQQNPSHSYGTMGNYSVVLSVTDASDITISDHTWAKIIGDNTAPTTPEITGEIQGKPRVIMNFTVMSTDPDGDTVSYIMDWGDETNSSCGPYASGEIITVTHTWSKKGTYVIRCKARDMNGAESEWGTLQIKIPTIVSSTLFLKFFGRFPCLFPILRYLLR